MPSPRSGSRWTLGLAVLALLWFAAMVRFDLWRLAGVPHLVPDFLDTHAILSAVDCHRLGYDVFTANPCDALHRPLGYSRVWLGLAPLGLDRSHGSVVGFLLAATFLAAAAATIAPRDGWEAALGALVLVSPAVMLGVERGNNDLVVFLLLVLAARASRRGSVVGIGVGLSSVWLAASLKFYPAAALALYLDRVRTPRGLLLLVAGSVLGLAALVWFVAPDLERLRDTVPSPLSRWTFGGHLLLRELGLPGWGPLAGLAVAGGAAAWGLSGRLAPDPGALPTEVRSLFVAAVAVLSVCFLANTNYDYRGVFLIAALPGLFVLRRSASRATRIAALVCLAATPLVLWAEIFVDWLALADGLGRPNFLVADRLRYPAVRIAEHALTWILMTVLAALALRLLREAGALTVLRLGVDPPAPGG